MPDKNPIFMRKKCEERESEKWQILEKEKAMVGKRLVGTVLKDERGTETSWKEKLVCDEGNKERE